LTRGLIFRLLGELENAILDFTTVIEKHPHNFKALIARGIALGQAGQFNAAFDDFSLAPKVNPNCAEGYYNKSLTLLSVGNLEEGFKLYEYR
jgi:tetratricopeptide (TPR) repeat protein